MDTVGGNLKAFDTRELFFLVAKFLEASPCQEAAKVLRRELSQNGLLPIRKNWLGEERQITYREVEFRTGHAQSSTLPLLCSKLLSLLEKQDNQRVSGLCSLLGSSVTAPLSPLDYPVTTSGTVLRTAVNHNELTVGFRKQPVANLCQLTCARQISPSISRGSLCGPSFYRGLKKHCSILGHLAPVFCVLFDHTGERIMTGADDNLIKIWTSRTGQLLATLRGHSAEVCDLSLSYNNTMIASGSLDKSVRVWCAQTSAPLAVLIGHQSQVTSVQFSPSSSEEHWYLASTGKDGFLCFWLWLPDLNAFSTTPVKFMEKNKMGDQTLCSNFSPGGKYFVTGGTDKFVRVYVCIPGPPTLMAEVLAHSDRIMTVQFGHTGEGLLATGSCDGTASIWRFTEDGWKNSSVLKLTDEELSMLQYKSQKSGRNDACKTQVTMLGWERMDRFLVTAVTPDCHVRIWCSQTGSLLRKLEGHSGEVFVLESHPFDSRILLTAGHDGLIILWDMLAGTRLTTFKLESQDQEVGVVRCIFDCKFSPDGTMVAAADIHGYVTLFGFGSSEAYKHPEQQFFHTDYHPLIQDRNHYVVDETTQLPPHLLPPPYLVDIDGNPHSTHHQEAIVRLFRLAKQVKQDRLCEEVEDYDEYMKNRISKLKHPRYGNGLGILGTESRNSSRQTGGRDNESRMVHSSTQDISKECSLPASSEFSQVNTAFLGEGNVRSQESVRSSSKPLETESGSVGDENAKESNDFASVASNCQLEPELNGDTSGDSVEPKTQAIRQQQVAGEDLMDVQPSTVEAVECVNGEGVMRGDSEAVEPMGSDVVECTASKAAGHVNSEAVKCVADEAVKRVTGEAVECLVGEAVEHMNVEDVEHVPSEAVESVTGEAVESVTGEAVECLVGEAVEHMNVEDVEHVPSEAVERVTGEAVESVTGEAVECLVGEAVEHVNVEDVEHVPSEAVERVTGEAVESVTGEAVECLVGEAVEHVNVEDVEHVPSEAVESVTGEAVECLVGEAVEHVNVEGVECMPSEAVECVTGEAVERVTGEAVKCVAGVVVESVAVDAVEHLPGEAVERVPGEAVERVPDEAVERVAVDAVEHMPGDAVERVSGEAVERVPGEAVEHMPGDAVERVSGEAVEHVPGEAVERVAGEAVEHVDVEGVVEGEDDNVQAMLSSLVYSLGLGEMEAKEAISLWQNRTIINPLDSGHLSLYLAKRQQLYEEEEARYRKMLDRSKLPSAAQVSTSAPISPKGRSLRSGRTILSSLISESTTTSDEESSNASEGVSLMDVWEESSTDSGDVSDWTAEVTSVPLGRKRTRRQRRLAPISDEDSDEDSKGGGEEGSERASPGQAQDGLSDKTSPAQSKGKKIKKGRSSVGPEAYALYKPPDWVKQTSPKLSPYLPQVGDIVVYCYQGHELYLADVKEQNTYPCKNVKPPWQKYNLLPQEFCQVTNVRFCVGPPTLCSITLALLSSAVCPVKGGASSSRTEKITFSFKYHDMDGVLDFLILDSVFKSSTQRSWEPGEQFQSLIDGSYWKGTVLERSPFSEELPQSHWQCYSVRWEDGVVDQLSPWDMHPLDSNLSDYIQEVMTTPTSLLEQEWGGAEEQERILRGLDTMLELDEAHMFREPVNLEDVPVYCTVVTFPTDLGTIKERLSNSQYRRKMALLWEVVQMWRNVVAFNLKDSLIVKHCRILVHMLWNFISSPDISDPMSCYEAHPVGEVGREVVVTPPLVEFTNSETIPLQTTQSPAPPAAHQPTSTALWVLEAERLLDALSDHHSSGPFLHPVDTGLYKNYRQVIPTPMDLSTVLSKLQSGQYGVPKDFISDLKLIFKNANNYNQKGSVVYKMAMELQSFFETIVLDFLKAFPGPSLVYGTRSALGKVASSMGVTGSSLRSSCSSISEPDCDSAAASNPVPIRTSRRLRAKRRRSQSSDSDVDVNDDLPLSPQMELSPVPRRVTRTRSKAGAPYDKYGGYGLRTRNSSQRVVEADSEESEASEEEASMGSRKSEEEEAYLEDLDSEDSHTSVSLSQRKRPRRSVRQSPRKRAKVEVDSDYSEEEIVTTRSRSGRLVKPTTKYFEL